VSVGVCPPGRKGQSCSRSPTEETKEEQWCWLGGWRAAGGWACGHIRSMRFRAEIRARRRAQLHKNTLWGAIFCWAKRRFPTEEKKPGKYQDKNRWKKKFLQWVSKRKEPPATSGEPAFASTGMDGPKEERFTASRRSASGSDS